MYDRMSDRAIVQEGISEYYEIVREEARLYRTHVCKNCHKIYKDIVRQLEDCPQCHSAEVVVY